MLRSENVKRFLTAMDELGIPRFEVSDLEKVPILPMNFLYNQYLNEPVCVNILDIALSIYYFCLSASSFMNLAEF